MRAYNINSIHRFSQKVSRRMRRFRLHDLLQTEFDIFGRKGIAAVKMDTLDQNIQQKLKLIEGQLGVTIPSPENLLGPNSLRRCGLLSLSLLTIAPLFTPGENHEMYSVASVSITIFSEEEGMYFGGSGFDQGQETWLSIQPAKLFPSSWTYSSGLLFFENGYHYVVKSSATDFIGNVQNTEGASRFLFDATESTGAVLLPVNGKVREDDLTMVGNFYDPGFTNGINIICRAAPDSK